MLTQQHLISAVCCSDLDEVCTRHQLLHFMAAAWWLCWFLLNAFCVAVPACLCSHLAALLCAPVTILL